VQRLVEADRRDQPLRVLRHGEAVDALVPDVPRREQAAPRRAREGARTGGAEREGHGAAGSQQR
jgi:hypothetical protein